MKLKALVLIGGDTIGTRFRPLSMDLPKILFPLCGKPLVAHIVDNLIDQFPIEDLEILLIGFFKDQSKAKFEEYIKDTNKEHSGLKIKYLSEPIPLGTGGGLYYFRNEIFGDTDCKLLMIHGDVICDYPFKEMLDFYDKTDSNITLYGVDPVSLLKKSKSQVTIGRNIDDENPIPDDDIVTKFGAIVANRKDSKVFHYVEKPSASISEFNYKTTYEILLNGGIYIFDRSILDLLSQAETKKANDALQFLDLDYDYDEEANKNVLSLELDVFKTLPQSKNTVFNVYKSSGFWYQLKSPLSALIANNFFLAHGDSTKISGSEITPPVQILTKELPNLQSCKIGPNVSVGKNVSIGNGVRLVNCIISDNVTIGDNTIVKNAIVSNGTKIGKWCRVEGTITAETLASNVINTSSTSFSGHSNEISILCHDTVVKNQAFVYNSVVLPHKEIKDDVKYEIVM
ncbi:SPBC13G1.02 Probable mannose-1-phosphate guanyltransferase [Candida maltosa Xu316]